MTLFDKYFPSQAKRGTRIEVGEPESVTINPSGSASYSVRVNGRYIGLVYRFGAGWRYWGGDHHGPASTRKEAVVALLTSGSVGRRKRGT